MSDSQILAGRLWGAAEIARTHTPLNMNVLADLLEDAAETINRQATALAELARLDSSEPSVRELALPLAGP